MDNVYMWQRRGKTWIISLLCMYVVHYNRESTVCGNIHSLFCGLKLYGTRRIPHLHGAAVVVAVANEWKTKLRISIKNVST